MAAFWLLAAGFWPQREGNKYSLVAGMECNSFEKFFQRQFIQCIYTDILYTYIPEVIHKVKAHIL
jgi:hypothetical protein